MRQMCEEMKKLRKMLDEKGIKWEDCSGITPDELIEKSVATGIDKNFADVTIYRTHFESDGYKYSVIYGYGTYGGYDPLSGDDRGLLECMTDKAYDGEPLGWLTAEQIMNIAKAKEE